MLASMTVISQDTEAMLPRQEAFNSEKSLIQELDHRAKSLDRERDQRTHERRYVSYHGGRMSRRHASGPKNTHHKSEWPFFIDFSRESYSNVRLIVYHYMFSEDCSSCITHSLVMV